MAGANYDGIAGLLRVTEAGANTDPFAVEVLAYHAAVESEMERVITNLVNRPDELFTTSPRLNFSHKVHLLKAVWNGDPEKADQICTVLHRLNELRNAVAHADPRHIKGCLAGLTIAYREIDSTIGDEVEIGAVAQGICLFFQDGPTVSELQAIAETVDRVVNRTLPLAFGNARK